MGYTVLRGSFVIRYSDLPRQGPEPDGDTVKFKPDNPSLVEMLPRRSGRPAQINSRGISVRLEAIDALETHFDADHQELVGANAARDALLAQLGFTGVTFFPDAPNKVQSADADAIRGHVLSNGIDANGRMIGFIYPGEPAEADGAQVFLDDSRVDNSVNANLLTTGLAYPAFYDTLPADLRDHLAGTSRAARAAGSGIWPRSTADPNGAATVADLAALEQLVIWPKLFRRIVPYFAAGFTDFNGFDAWLRADPVSRDDALFLLSEPAGPGNLHDVVNAIGQSIQLTVWPEDFVIQPDPAPPGTSTGPRPHAASDVVIVAALPDPAGADAGNETVLLLNTTAKDIDLTGWQLIDAGGGRQTLAGNLAGGGVSQIGLGTHVQLGNAGDTLILAGSDGATIDTVTYTGSQVRPGRVVVFGRSPS
jgi:endonuclease YncB( thermonuclease family)